MRFPKLRHFKPAEFREWASRMDHRFLYALEYLRIKSGVSLSISPHPKALGRTTGSTRSQHYWTGKQLAVADIIPEMNSGGLTAEGMKLLVAEAKKIGFTGIGVYPAWSPAPGIHLDMRPQPDQGRVSTWSELKTPNGKKKFYALSTVWDYYSTGIK